MRVLATSLAVVLSTWVVGTRWILPRESGVGMVALAAEVVALGLVALAVAGKGRLCGWTMLVGLGCPAPWARALEAAEPTAFAGATVGLGLLTTYLLLAGPQPEAAPRRWLGPVLTLAVWAAALGRADLRAELTALPLGPTAEMYVSADQRLVCAVFLLIVVISHALTTWGERRVRPLALALAVLLLLRLCLPGGGGAFAAVLTWSLVVPVLVEGLRMVGRGRGFRSVSHARAAQALLMALVPGLLLGTVFHLAKWTDPSWRASRQQLIEALGQGVYLRFGQRPDPAVVGWEGLGPPDAAGGGRFVLRWVTRGAAEVAIRLERPVDRRLRAKLYPLPCETCGPRWVRILLNGHDLARFQLDEAPRWYDVPLAESAQRAGVNLLRFEFTQGLRIPARKEWRSAGLEAIELVPAAGAAARR